MYEYIFLNNHLDIDCNTRIRASETLCLKIYSSKKKTEYCVCDAFFYQGWSHYFTDRHWTARLL